MAEPVHASWPTVVTASDYAANVVNISVKPPLIRGDRPPRHAVAVVVESVQRQDMIRELNVSAAATSADPRPPDARVFRRETPARRRQRAQHVHRVW